MQYYHLDISSDERGLLLSQPFAAGSRVAQAWRADRSARFGPLVAVSELNDPDLASGSWSKAETEVYFDINSRVYFVPFQ